jgi:integrase
MIVWEPNWEPTVPGRTVAERRGRGEDAVYYDHMGTPCRDEKFHRRCSGRWRGEINLGRDGSGKRLRRKVSGRTKTEVYAKLAELRDELDQGVHSSRTYTVGEAVTDWLATLTDRDPKTVATLTELLSPLRQSLGGTRLRELTADDVLAALQKSAASRSSRTVRDSRAALVRAITHAQARGLVGWNVASLIKAPPGGSPGRPSRALSVGQAELVLRAAERDRLHAYVVVSLLTGIRTEEARALLWTDVDLRGDPPRVTVRRSVRAGGDTKTASSRRALELPERAVAALQAHRLRQDQEREHAGPAWTETGLVFTTTTGDPLDAANVRRSFRRICAAAGIGESWSPRELRHTFVSIMSDAGVPIERIADLVGHTGGSRVTELIYRKQLRPVLREGATVMDQALKPRRRAIRRKAE